MAIELPNSVFIHVPKTGGRWVKDMLLNYVEGAKPIGDAVYDSHNTPKIHDKPCFAFLRHPMTWVHSLFHHRAKKKANRNGHQWNWQEQLRLEKECKAENYEDFLSNVVNTPNVVRDYFNYYTTAHYPMIQFGYMENLAQDLILMLDGFNEKFDEPSIQMHHKLLIGARNNEPPISVANAMIKEDYLEKMKISEAELFKLHPIWTH